MSAPVVRRSPSFCSYMGAKLSAWLPSLSMSGVKEAFSALASTINSTPSPLTNMKISSGGILKQLKNNRLEFTEYKSIPIIFNNDKAFAKYIACRVDISLWNIEIQSDK